MKQIVVIICLAVFASILPVHEAFAEDKAVYNSKSEISFWGEVKDADQGLAHNEGGGITTLPQTGDQVSPAYILYGLILILLSFWFVRQKIKSRT
ncbi:LPXTG cell wall anchor domain-containing protein [Paenibacillus larvae]